MGLSPSYVPLQRNGQPAEFTSVSAASLTVSGEADTGSLAVSGAASAGSLTVSGEADTGSLAVSGAASAGSLTVSGETDVQGLTVHQPASMNTIHAADTHATQLDVSGAASAASLTVSGAASAASLTVSGALALAEGADAISGAVALAAGTATVTTSRVTADSRIQLTVQELGTVTDPQPVAVTARTAGTSFTIRSADATDTSLVAWQIITPAA